MPLEPLSSVVIFLLGRGLWSRLRPRLGLRRWLPLPALRRDGRLLLLLLLLLLLPPFHHLAELLLLRCYLRRGFRLGGRFSLLLLRRCPGLDLMLLPPAILKLTHLRALRRQRLLLGRLPGYLWVLLPPAIL